MQNVSPHCEARVSSELIRLMRGLPSPEAEPEPAPRAARSPAPRRKKRRASGPPARRLSLRIDGARPLQFHGEALCAASWRQPVLGEKGQIAEITTHLQLFRAEDGRIVAHVASEPGPGLPARPIHRAADLALPDDLAALLESATGAACLASAPPGLGLANHTFPAPRVDRSGIRLPLRDTSIQETAP